MLLKSLSVMLQAGVIGIENGEGSAIPREGARIAMIGKMNMIRSDNCWFKDR